MNKLLLVGAGAGVLAYTQYREFELFKDALGYDIKNIAVESLGLNNVVLRFNIIISNPRNYSAKAQSMRVNLMFQNNVIGTANIMLPFEIKKASVTVIPARFAIPYNSAIPGIVNLFTLFTQNFTVPLRVDGIVRFGLFDAKFNTNFNIL